MDYSGAKNWESIVSRIGGMIVLGPPKVEKATIGLFTDHEGQETTSSMLRSADVLLEHDVAQHWLEHIFYKATNLETLSLTVKQPPGQWLIASRVVLPLRSFTLSQAPSSQTPISVEDLLAILASSKESLTHITLRSITLTGSTWRNVISLLAALY